MPDEIGRRPLPVARRREFRRLRSTVGGHGQHACAEGGPFGGVDPQPDAVLLAGDPVEERLGHGGLAATAHSMEHMDPSSALAPDGFRQPGHQVGAVPEDPGRPAHERGAYGVGRRPVEGVVRPRPDHRAWGGRLEEGATTTGRLVLGRPGLGRVVLGRVVLGRIVVVVLGDVLVAGRLVDTALPRRPAFQLRVLALLGLAHRSLMCWSRPAW